jgi:uncharacterized membrane protein
MEVKHEYALETTTLPNQRFDAVVLGGTCGILDLDLASLQNDTSFCMTLKGFGKMWTEVITVIQKVLIDIKTVEIIYK